MTQITTDDIAIGDKVHVSIGSSFRADVRIGTVRNRTANGRIDVQLPGIPAPIRFNVTGRALGSGSTGAEPRLIDKPEYDRLLIAMNNHRQITRVRSAIARADEIPVTPDNREKLLDALRAAITAVEGL